MSNMLDTKGWKVGDLYKGKVILGFFIESAPSLWAVYLTDSYFHLLQQCPLSDEKGNLLYPSGTFNYWTRVPLPEFPNKSDYDRRKDRD